MRIRELLRPHDCCAWLERPQAGFAGWRARCRKRPCWRAAERGYQFTSCDVDSHATLRCRAL
jgi:hypothetical protein